MYINETFIARQKDTVQLTGAVDLMFPNVTGIISRKWFQLSQIHFQCPETGSNWAIFTVFLFSFTRQALLTQ